MRRLIVSTLVIAGMTTLSASAQTLVTNKDDQTDLRLTIYNADRALIKDTRQFSLPGEMVDLEFRDISGKIDASSAILEGEAVKRVQTQTFSYDLLTMASLYRKHLGEKLTVTNYDVYDLPGKENPVVINHYDAYKKPESYQATLLSVDGGQIIIQRDDTQAISVLPMLSHKQRIEFASVPANLKATPTLSMAVQGTGEPKGEISLTYLSNGFDWRADYVANLESPTRMSVKSLVTLNNRSNTDYMDAEIQLLAGKVNIVQPQRRLYEKSMDMRAMSALAEQAPVEKISGYRLYTLPFKIDLLNNEQQQATLFTASNVAYHKRYDATAHTGSNTKSHVSMTVVFDNTKESGLGVPMPAGKFRTYGSSKSGAVQFLGESNIDHTGRKETVEVLMGEAFGVTAKHISKEQRRVSRYITELTQGWELINSEDTAITIRLTETNLGSGAESVKFDTRYSDYVPEKHVEGVYRTEVTLDPGEKRQVFYKARVTYP